MSRALRILTLAVVVLTVLSNHTWALRKSRRQVEEVLRGPGRYVDMGIRLHVVAADPDGDAILGHPDDKPKLRILETFERGGIIDRAVSPATFCAKSENPVVWYCSQQAAPLILHGDEMPLRLLVYGAMGAGKTTTMVQWLGMRLVEFTGRKGQIGITCPTNDRSQEIRDAIAEWWPSEWWTWNERRMRYSIANGLSVRIKSTHQQSRKAGARIQGMTWLAAASDEIQDSSEANGDIEARGRGAPGGNFRRFCTATAKDDPGWRTFRDKLLATKPRADGRLIWGRYTMSGLDSPFILPVYWADLAETMDPREYQRKVLGLDVAPEDRIYTSWDRDQNVRPIPVVGAKDVTAAELARIGYPGAGLLVGHDPGLIFNVSVILRAFQYPNEPAPVWFVVGEVTDERTTTEGHGRHLIQYIRERWGQTQALVHIDPHSYGKENDDSAPDLSKKNTLVNLGLLVRDAAYQPGSTKPGKVPREAAIDMVNTLLCSATNKRRLFVACDENRKPLAPKLVEAFERAQRSTDGKAERGRKDKNDLTHWPAALRYALWKIERPRLDAAQRRGA